MNAWTPLQRDCLEAMGFEVMRLRDAEPVAAPRADSAGTRMPVPRATNDVLMRDDERGAAPLAKAAGAPIHAAAATNDALMRAARGVDVAALFADCGRPGDAAGRRAFWRRLRPLRKAARHA